MTESQRSAGGAVAGVGVGTVLAGRYVLEEVLATGGMGAIFRGYDRLLERPVAIKTLHPHLAGTPYADRFLQEGQTVAALAHPNLVTIYDMGRMESLPYLVMEYVRGESLAAILERDGPLSPAAGIPLAVQICRGLAYAHERGVVHRDIKPQNILVTPAGQVKIVDFGIARGPAAAEMTEPGWVLGTAHYLAPEVVAGQPATPRSDLYALGVVLYRLFTGRLPFAGDDPLAVAMLHRTAPVPPPSVVRPELPRSLEAPLLRLLEKDPERRYPSATAVATALGSVDVPSAGNAAPTPAAVEEATTLLPQGMPVSGGPPPTPGRGGQRGRRSRKRRWALLLGTVLPLAALIWLWLGLTAPRVGEVPQRAPSSPAARQTAPSVPDRPALTPVPSEGRVPDQTVEEHPGRDQPVVPPVPTEEIVPEILAMLQHEVSDLVTGGMDDERVEDLMGRVEDLADQVMDGGPKDVAKALAGVRKEITDLVRRGDLPPTVAARLEALARALADAAQQSAAWTWEGR
ncbi:MAG: protein kinase [Chloroflexi bacterium]|nr:protein kinase [Chloroflexota bacterium]